MAGNDLTVILFLASSTAAFLIAGMHQAKLAHRVKMTALFGIAGLFTIAAALWFQIKVIWPTASLEIADIAYNPVSWVVLFVLLLIGSYINSWRSTHPIPAINTTRLEKIDRAQVEINADLHAALTFELDIATFFVLDDLVNDTPKFKDMHLGPDEERKSRYDDAHKFIRRASSSFRDSHRGMEISALLSNATIRADQHLRATPPDQRPSHIDPLDLLKYTTMEFKCISLIIYLVAQKTEKQEQIISERGKIIDRLKRHS